MSHTLRDNGLMVWSDPGADKPILEVKTLQCVHCGGHFPHQPGSGKTRGFCMRCSGPVCGPGCQECIPWEAQLEIMEGTRKPTSVSVGGNLWLG